MKKSSKPRGAKAPKVDPYLEGVVAKLVDRLVALERKVDVVISQTAGRPSGGNHSDDQQAKQPSRKDRTLYEAICADCHKVCEVPFRPTEDRPVYCKVCFAKRRSGASGMPVLTPVALAPKPVSKLGMSQLTASPAPAAGKRSKKTQPAKRSKKKK